MSKEHEDPRHEDPRPDSLDEPTNTDPADMSTRHTSFESVLIPESVEQNASDEPLLRPTSFDMVLLPEPGNSASAGKSSTNKRPHSRSMSRMSLGTTNVSAPAPSKKSGNPTALELLKSLRHCWKRSLALGVIVGCMGALVAWFAINPPKYTARSLLDVAANPKKIIFETNDNRSDFARYQRKQMALIKSRLVLGTALSHPDIAELKTVRERENPVHWLEEELDVDFTIAPEIMRVSLSGDRREDLTRIVDAVVAAYFDEVVNKEARARRDRLEQLKQLERKYVEEVRRKMQTIRAVAKSAGSANTETLEFKHRYALEQLSFVQKELRQSQIEKGRLEAKRKVELAKFKSEIPIAAPPQLVDQLFAEVQQIADAKAIISDLEYRIELVKEAAVPSAVDMLITREKAELAKWQNRLEALKDQWRPVVMQRLKEQNRNAAQANLEMLNKELAVVSETVGWLGDVVNRLEKETESTLRYQLDLAELRDEIQHGKGFGQKVAQKAEALEVELQAPSRINLLEESVVSSPNAVKGRTMMSGMAFLGGFGFVVVGLAWLEFSARRLHHVDEIEGNLGLRLVGVVPPLPIDWEDEMGDNNESKSDLTTSYDLVAESADATRAILLHDAGQFALRVIMVTSARAKEGKTSLASNLAASLARSGRKTLLLDGDMRRPSGHDIFDLPLGPGLAEVLRHEVDCDDVLLATTVPGLWLLPAGSCNSKALHELTRDTLPQLFAKLRDRFDFIVVDTCPILPVADALSISRCVDGAIISLLQNVSQLPHVQVACQKLRTLGVRVLGAVVNGVRSDIYAKEYQGSN